MIELLTDDLLLRTLTSDDLDEIARMWNYPAGVTCEAAAEILRGMQLLSRTAHGGYNFVMDKEGYFNEREGVSEGV